MAKTDNNMQLWEEEYIKALGIQRIENLIKYINGDLSLNEYNQKQDEYRGQFKPFTDISVKNYEAGMLYDFTAQTLLNLDSTYNNMLHAFASNNADVRYILDMIFTSEIRIAGEIEYNRLLDAIPNEAKKEMPEEVLKRKDIQETINTTANLEYAISKEGKSKGEATTDMLENPTYLYARMMFIVLIFETIYKTFKLKNKIKLKDPIKNNEDFETVTKNIKKVFVCGNERIKNFEDTIFYKRFNHYQNIEKVIERKDYKEEAKKQEKIIKERIYEQVPGQKILNEIEQNLFKQGWWYIDE